MKRTLLLLILLAISHVGYCQLCVGVAGGYTHNTLDSDGGYYNREYSPMKGYSVAFPIQYSFNDWFALRSELAYMTKSYRWDFSYIDEEYPEYSITEYQEYRNGYLSIPVMANFGYCIGRVRAFVNIGAWVGAWLNGKVSGETIGFFNYEWNNIETAYTFDSRRDNRFDGGLLCGIGAQYALCSKIGIFVEGRYMYGLSNMQKSYLGSYPRYNTTILVQLGATYSFDLK